MRILIFIFIAMLLVGCNKSSKKKFRIPAEWEEQEAVWLSWDDQVEHRNLILTDLAKQLKSYVNVKVAFSSDSVRRVAYKIMDSLKVDTLSIKPHIYPGINTWIRDYGAVFAIDSTQNLAVMDFGWNGYGWIDWMYERWPERFEGFDLDSVKTSWKNLPRGKADSLMGISTQAKNYKIDVILEGGSFEYNGNSVLIQSEAVTLQRNPDKTKKQIEQEFKHFGIEKVIWLPQGVIEDEHYWKLVDNKYMVGGTGGHTDAFVRFADEHTILLAWIDENEIDEHPLNRENYDRMNRNYEILKNATDINGKPFKIIKMPIPRAIETPLIIVEEYDDDNWKNQVVFEMLEKGHTLKLGDTIYGIAAAEYLNFLITNGVVISQSYAAYGSEEKDEEVKKILQQVFPDRKVIMLDTRPLNSNYGGGGIHCATMQEPKVK